MRVLVPILYIVLLAICGLGIKGGGAPDYPSVPFNLLRANSATIRSLYWILRQRVTQATHTINGLPVLNPDHLVLDRQRFLLVSLIVADNPTVTLALDVVNLNVVAFSENSRSYFFRDSTELQRNNLFVNTTQSLLSFTGSYISLENAARAFREFIPLGLTPLIDAITGLAYHQNIPRSLLVVIQMISEAARFRYIEEQVIKSIIDENTFTPKGLILSMENNWSSMSLEVQRAIGGVIFQENVQLQNDDYSPLIVDNFNTLSRYTMVAVLLYQCIPTTSSGSSRTKKKADVLAVEYNNNETCTILEATRRISGRDGLCVYVRGGQDENPIQLGPCGLDRNQQWTFHTDGTIRSMGKCMTANWYIHRNYVMIFNCSMAAQDATKWVVSIDGSITNPRFGLVLTAPNTIEGTILHVENNIHAARQGWSVGNNVEPIVTFIVGFNEMCLQANNENNRVWLEDCVLNSLQQRWALYSDGTIRVNSDRSLCVTSDGHSSGDVIIILECQGSGNQRWVFNTDGTILNPNATLVMEVKQGDVSLQQIILNQPTKNLNQQWATQTNQGVIASSGEKDELQIQIS